MIDICSGKKNASEIDQALNNTDQMTSTENNGESILQISDSNANTQSTNSSKQQPKELDPDDRIDHSVNGDKNEQIMKDKLVMKDQQNQTLSSNDNLADKNQSSLSTYTDKQ